MNKQITKAQGKSPYGLEHIVLSILISDMFPIKIENFKGWLYEIS
jgi:hypothetical protein